MEANPDAGTPYRLARPPIIEAVLDVDCDLPVGLPLDQLEAPGHEQFASDYPIARKRYHDEFTADSANHAAGVEPSVRWLYALQWLRSDATEVVQLRAGGFSFNRLAPYEGLDAHLPAIRRAWDAYVRTARPIVIRRVSWRFINRICIPMETSGTDLDLYFTQAPRLPAHGFATSNFLTQVQGTHEQTQFDVSIVQTSQEREAGALPVLLDVTVADRVHLESDDSAGLWSRVQALRKLKNEIFYSLVTPKCLQLFR